MNAEKISKKGSGHKLCPLFLDGEPGGIRTPDPQLRRLLLYPTELLTHIGFVVITIVTQQKNYNLIIVFCQYF